MGMIDTPGMIGVIAQESARFNQFTADLCSVDRPGGTLVRFRFGWDLADTHNALIAEMLDRKDLEWIWFMGDDHAFSATILNRLLRHDLDIVVPLCLMRNAPYRPVNWVYDDTAEHGVARIDLNDYPDGGLVEIARAGSAGLLVKRRVFEQVEFPWFETGTGITNRVGEDINFCVKATEAGFKIHTDLDTVLGHCSTTVVWPVREQDGWTFGFSMMGGFHITLPPGFQQYADDCAR